MRRRLTQFVSSLRLTLNKASLHILVDAGKLLKQQSARQITLFRRLKIWFSVVREGPTQTSDQSEESDDVEDIVNLIPEG